MQLSVARSNHTKSTLGFGLCQRKVKCKDKMGSPGASRGRGGFEFQLECVPSHFRTK